MNIFNLIWKNDYETLKKNISKVDVNELDSINRNALFYARSYEIVKLLLDNGINVNQVSSQGWNALFYVESYEIVKLLIDNGIHVNHVNNSRHNALYVMYELFRVHLDVNIAKLLIDNGININPCLTKYAINNNWKIIPIFDKFTLNNPNVQEYKDKFLFIDDPNNKDDNSFIKDVATIDDYCRIIIYRRLRKYFNVNNDDEVDLIMGDL